MELNRNHFFVLGTILLFIGIQFRFVDSFVLNPESSRFISERLDWKKRRQTAQTIPSFLRPMTPRLDPPEFRRHVRPPRWLGWSFISVGGVMMLQSLAMRRPE
jgi:hypothetical protein